MAATFKIGSLVIKTLSKPLANALKRRAKEHPAFSKFCMLLAGQYEKLDLGLKKQLVDPTSVPTIIGPTTESAHHQKAVEFGANFLSEIIIFSVGGL
jgi:hypothetical protein